MDMKNNEIKRSGGKVKVAFITVHVGENFGSALQAIATFRTLEKVGTEPILVNYVPPRVTVKGYISRSLKSLDGLIRGFLKFPCFIKNKSIFESYIKAHCDITEPIYTEDVFVEKCPKADFYVTGSDQVWNFFYNEGLDEHYFFKGITGNKISYASSIGMEKLNDKESANISGLLRDYKQISVREESARRILHNLGYNDVLVLLDPTFMLDREEWASLASDRLVAEPYLFVYMPYNASDKEAHYRVIRKIAHEKDLRIVSFSLTYLKDKRADETIFYPSPGDFVSLVKHADFVVTNSFHGTAFSINLNKQFVTITPARFSNRIENILNITKLSSKMIRGLNVNEITDDVLDSVDYNCVNNILDNRRQSAFNYLTSVLK